MSTPYAYQCDRAGSVVGLTDAAGTLVASYRYDPWGSITATGGSNLTLANRNPLRYRGYYYDTVTALYYMPARYYDPATARFLSPDPAAPSAGDPLSLNRYAYCVGGPVNASDPSGAIPDVDGDGRVGPADVSIGRRSALRRSLLSTGRWNLAQSEREAQRYMAQIARWDVAIQAARNVSTFCFAFAFVVGTMAAAGFTGEEVVWGNAAGATAAVEEVAQQSVTHVHHIVAQSSPRAQVARDALSSFGISVQDGINKVALTANTKVPNMLGTNVHSTLHTMKYYEYVNGQIGAAQSAEEAVEILGYSSTS